MRAKYREQLPQLDGGLFLHAELDNAPEIDIGNPLERGGQYRTGLAAS